MAPALVSECVEVQVRPVAPRRVPDSELAILLADLRPSPRRAPELVKLRAEALGLIPTPAPIPHRYRVWPFLITAAGAGAYLYVGLVVR